MLHYKFAKGLCVPLPLLYKFLLALGNFYYQIWALPRQPTTESLQARSLLRQGNEAIDIRLPDFLRSVGNVVDHGSVLSHTGPP